MPAPSPHVWRSGAGGAPVGLVRLYRAEEHLHNPRGRRKQARRLRRRGRGGRSDERGFSTAQNCGARQAIIPVVEGYLRLLITSWPPWIFALGAFFIFMFKSKIGDLIARVTGIGK